MHRRDVLRAALALAAAQALPRTARAEEPRFVADPFSLGVASGWPRPDGVSLWTRLAPVPLLADGGLDPVLVPVTAEVAEDEGFTRIVATVATRAVPELGHAVHVDVSGLQPGRWYFYRFHAGAATSPTGRTRTADAPDARVAGLRFAIASCQHFEQGWYTAHRHLLDENLDLMLFLGDYIYETSWGDTRVRQYFGPEPVTLAQYRVRYAQHRTDPNLRRLHAAVPWLVTWDDHEVDNDWAGDRSENLDPAFGARRAAAFQAYWEHMPLPVARAPVAGRLRLYEQFAFGDLARFYVLDNRQHRSPQPCPSPAKGGGSTVYERGSCREEADPAATLLGPEQEGWLDGALRASRARWNLVAQQTLVSPLDWTKGPSVTTWTDHWDGYPAARRRLIASLQKSKATNPVLLGGDHHATYVSDLHADPLEPGTPIVATEFVGTSFTSEGNTREESEAMPAENPHLRYANGWQRGYLRFALTPDRCEVTVRAVETHTPDGGVADAASFAVASGRTGVER